MTRRARSASLLALLVPVAIAACGGGEGNPNETSGTASGSGAAGGSGGSGGGTGGGGGVPACDVHATAGVAHFTDRSDAWGLTPAQIVGNRISAADLNGDGYPDLVIHAIGSNNREQIGSGKHLLYVLMNEPKDGGGRQFVDRTAESGYGATLDASATEYRSAQLAIFADVDNDGDLDVFSGVYTNPDLVAVPPTAADLDRSQILLNDGAGHFTIKQGSAVPPVTGKTTTGASFVDVDRNGKLDLFLGFWYGASSASPQQLFLGNGDGSFVDISQAAGVTTSANRRPAYGVTACDVNGDGLSELIVSGYGRSPEILYVNDGTQHFNDVAVAANAAYDDNQDYQDNEFFKCYCTLHAADADCQGVLNPSVVCPQPADAYWSPTFDTKPNRLGGNTFTTVCSDITGDGALDLYNAEIAHWWAGQSSDRSQLLVNRNDPAAIVFDRIPPDQNGMAWDHPTVDWNEGGIMAAAADLDNDGREDVVVGASDYPDQFGLFFHQKPDGTFEEIGEAQGFHHPCVSGIAIADFDRDGDLDVVVGSGTARDCGKIWATNEVHFYENDASALGHYLAIKLRGDGTTTNTTGIGARVVIDANGVKITKELGAGYGHMGMQNDTALFFGLGACAAVNSVEVTWPNQARTVERFENVTTDRLIELRQGDPAVYDVIPKP
jgi:hypothetical protein